MRHKTVFTAALVVVAMAIAPIGAAAAQSTDAGTTNATSFSAVANETESNETNVSAGERLSGIVGVQAAEIDGDLEQRSFGIRIAKAASNSSKATVINETVGDLQGRLAELREQKEQLRGARDNGSISQGQYAARMASLSAKTETVRQLANQTENESEKLPADVLGERGIDVTAIRTLQQDASNMSGPEVAAVARSITGPNADAGSDDAQGPPENATEDGDAESTTGTSSVERAEGAVKRASDSVNRADSRLTDDSGDAADVLATAKTQLDEANATLDAAREALDAGDDAEASELAAKALEQASDADESAQNAIEQAGGGQAGDSTDDTTTSTTGK